MLIDIAMDLIKCNPGHDSLSKFLPIKCNPGSFWEFRLTAFDCFKSQTILHVLTYILKECRVETTPQNANQNYLDFTLQLTFLFLHPVNEVFQLYPYFSFMGACITYKLMLHVNNNYHGNNEEHQSNYLNPSAT